MTAMPYATLALLQGASTNAIAPILMYAAIFAIFYFLLIRPQQQQRKQHEQAIMQVKKGDRVVTAGGIIGEVQHIKAATPATPEDEVTIKTGDVRVVVERGRIVKISSANGTTSSADKVA